MLGRCGTPLLPVWPSVGLLHPCRLNSKPVDSSRTLLQVLVVKPVSASVQVAAACSRKRRIFLQLVDKTWSVQR